MKKLSAIFLAFTLIFSSVGTTLLFNDEQVAEAKSYKSGKKNYNNSSTNNNNTNNVQKNDTETNTNATKNTTTKTTDASKTGTASKGGFSAGGLMKGLIIGGLAGMLFGGLFGDMGMLGNILGFAINALAIAVVIVLLVKIFKMITRKKDKEATNTWKK